MPYRMKPQRSVAHEIKRVADTQLIAALDHLQSIGTPRADESVHEARRHIKKVRALLRLVKPVLVDGYDGANRRLRTVCRMLAPIADGRSVIATLPQSPHGDDVQEAPTLDAIRAALVQRANHVDRKAELERILPKARRILSLERTRVDDWTLRSGGARAVTPGLARSVHKTRKAMSRAVLHPTAANYHVWRQRVKDLWFHVRLIEARCGNGFEAERRRLGTLDACLGEYHNVILLEHVLMTEAIVTRGDTTRGLRMLRAYQVALRRRAEMLGRRALAPTPREMVAKLRRLWRSTGAPPAAMAAPAKAISEPRRRRSRESGPGPSRPPQGPQARPRRRRAAAQSGARSSADRRSARGERNLPAQASTSR